MVLIHLFCTSKKNSFNFLVKLQSSDFFPNLLLYNSLNSSKFRAKIWSLLKRFIKFLFVFERHSKIESNSGKILYCKFHILVTISDFLLLSSAIIRKICLREHISFQKDLRTNQIQTLSLLYGFAKHSNFHF